MTAVKYMTMSDDNLRGQDPWLKQEFIERLAYCKEFNSEITPDASTMESGPFRGLLFSVY